ncbi:maleylpyruvate isomerase family mycothiol-dependent enzyme [Nakamurella aerolata]|uniref:Maleylpyruvate isomerase family mycothiol-dependent enzyme n=1 Tax=Nakamurella aerolata TaxID=1656892 RepID=A0A849A558_9ACTN|nr:maleylpyruvate isomerase family mycothiol-dependent enzyme [Nakamurella aerolata]NNG34503.1 maleylpyruvate isomerase family mycothiol-dependent enzyme [Nakamurella aerolata]
MDSGTPDIAPLPGPGSRSVPGAGSDSHSADGSNDALVRVVQQLEWLRRADDRLRETVQDAAWAAQPTRALGWTVGHVLTHLARNADGLRNLLLWARSGVELSMYPSPESRDADVNIGATRPDQVILADVEVTSRAFLADAAGMPAAAWFAQVQTRGGGVAPATVVPSHRLTEVLLHTHDLGIGRGLNGLDPELAGGLLDAMRDTYLRTHALPDMVLQATDSDVTVVVDNDAAGAADAPEAEVALRISGPAWALAGWLTGRHDGAALEATGPLPQPPPW